MLSVFTRLMAGVLLLASLGASAADLAGTALARETAVQIFLLRMETSLIVYDDTTDEHVKLAKSVLAATAPLADACVKDLAAKDAAAAAAMKENWRVLRLTLTGGGEFGRGIFNIGYDAATHGYFDDNAQKIDAALDKNYSLSTSSATLESRTLLLAARAISGYIQSAANPFGSYTNSFNTEDGDLNVMVAKLDKLLAEFQKKYQADAGKREQARKIVAKWQFIRTTILRAGTQSTPMIVYKHGGDIIRELKTFN